MGYYVVYYNRYCEWVGVGGICVVGGMGGGICVGTLGVVWVLWVLYNVVGGIIWWV